MKRIARAENKAENESSHRVPSKRRQQTKGRSFVSVLARREERPPPVHNKVQPQASRLVEKRSDREDTFAEEGPHAEPRQELLRGDEYLYNPVLFSVATNVSPVQVVPQASALERAQAAALAERVLHSVQVGRVQGGHLVRLRLSPDVEVQLRHIDGVLQATVVGEGDQGALARRLDTEFRARGLRFDRVELG